MVVAELVALKTFRVSERETPEPATRPAEGTATGETRKMSGLGIAPNV